MSSSAELIASLHIAEEALDAAIEAKEWYNASRWRELINADARELEKVLRVEDPATTMADVRYFEGFKYV